MSVESRRQKEVMNEWHMQSAHVQETRVHGKFVKEGHDDEDKPEEFDNTVEDEALLGLGDVKEVHGLNNSVVKSGNKVDFKEVYEDEDKLEEFNDTVEDEALLEIGNPPLSPMAGIRLPSGHALLLTRPSLLLQDPPVECQVGHAVEGMPSEPLSHPDVRVPEGRDREDHSGEGLEVKARAKIYKKALRHSLFSLAEGSSEGDSANGRPRSLFKGELLRVNI